MLNKIPEPPKKKKPRRDSEAYVKTECLKVANKMGCFVWRQAVYRGRIMGRYYLWTGIKGCADLVGILPDGRHLEIECKARHSGRQRPEQKLHQEKIESRNGVYILAHSGAELAERLEKLI